MSKCNLCNEQFFMTNDTHGIVIAEPEDMYRLESPCRSCNKEVREECKKQLISIITQKPIPDVDATALINKYKENGSNPQNRTNQNGVRKSKKYN